MNSQRLAQLHISPLHIQQGLFASLALLVTLIAGQQFERWDNHQEARQAHQITQQFTTTKSYTTVSAPVSNEAALSLQPVEGTVAEQAHQQSWVF